MRVPLFSSFFFSVPPQFVLNKYGTLDDSFLGTNTGIPNKDTKQKQTKQKINQQKYCLKVHTYISTFKL